MRSAPRFTPVRLLLSATLCVAAGRGMAQLEPLREETGHSGLGLALRSLRTTASILYVTAHPDDENNALVVTLSRGLGMRVGLLTLTRGEGGQNEIGPELFEALGVLRTEELLATHLYDGAEQFFSRAYEFGYSFSVEETLEKWGQRETLGDIVRVIRAFRPHVILTMMPGGAGGGQHHQASARLALDAFRLAADPAAYPGQLVEGLRPWQARKLYHVVFATRRAVPPGALRISVGDFDPLLGMSYAEYGALARNSHRCQGMNAAPVPGPRWVHLVSGASVLETPSPGEGLLDGVDTSIAGLASLLGQPPEGRVVDELRALEEIARQTRDSFEVTALDDVAVHVLKGLDLLRTLRRGLLRDSPDDPGRAEADFRFAREEEEWNLAAVRAHQLSFRASVVGGDALPAAAAGGNGTGAVDGLVTRGETFLVEVQLVNRSRHVTRVDSLDLSVPAGWESVRLSGENGAASYNEVDRWLYRVTVGPRARYTAPHWRRRDIFTYRFETTAPPAGAMLPFLPPDVNAELVLTSRAADGVRMRARAPVQHRWFDPQSSTHRGFAVKVVPGIALRAIPENGILPLHSPRRYGPVEVSLHNHFPRAVRGEVELSLPDGWRSEPPRHRLELSGENEEASLGFRVFPPPAARAGAYRIRAIARFEGQEFHEGYREIAYHHIQTRHLYRPAASTIRLIDVEVAEGLHVGYVMGVGDEVAAAIENLGARLTLLEGQDLRAGDLSRFDLIVTGIRAYKERRDLIASNRRLLDYVERGGVLIAQYNKYEFNRDRYGPYPLSISRPHDRVTDEDSPVRILVPESPVFNVPNKLGPADWQGWVQERGLYFLGSWDERYTPLLELEDPFPYNSGKKRGALVLARFGKGIYVYTGIGFFRQLPAGVAGAYRLFANLLSLPKTMR